MQAPLLPQSPFRFQVHRDLLCYISMKIEWTDEADERQRWSSWEDSLCSCHDATKFLPASSRDIHVSFKSQPGGNKVMKVDRHRSCKWVKGEEEVICFRTSTSADGQDSGIDARFEIAGPLLGCYVRKAWNARNGGFPESWERWDNFAAHHAELPPPRTLQLADEAAPPTAEGRRDADDAGHVATAVLRLRAACIALLESRATLRSQLEELDAKMTKQWKGVNSTNTASAGLAVASFALCTLAPPVGVALGVTSAATGMAGTARDVHGDRKKFGRFYQAVHDDTYEQLGYESIEAEFRSTCQMVLASTQKGAGGWGSAPRTVGALAACAQAANATSVAARYTVRVGRAVGWTRAGQGTAAAGRVLGGVGAGLAIGVAIHGWSTTKPTQKLIRAKLAEVERSVTYLNTFADQVTHVLRCPLCEEPLDFGNAAVPMYRCRQFHCFHAACVRKNAAAEELTDATASSYCPLCPGGASQSPDVWEVSGPSERLKAMLWLFGGPDREARLAVLTPQSLARGKELIKKFFAQRLALDRADHDDMPALVRSQILEPFHAAPPMLHRTRSRNLLQEDADTHEAWQEAIERAGSPLDLDVATLDRILPYRAGMPLKYRHNLWPAWLQVDDRRAEAAANGESFEAWATASLPQRIEDEIAADVHRTDMYLNPDDGPAKHAELRRLLTALSARSPSVGYAQGMNHLAAVVLKLGFSEEVGFWIVVAALEDLLPSVHAPDLRGLFRDTAVVDVLIGTYLPSHARALSDAGIETMWIVSHYFLTLGSRDAPLPITVRLWDLCFLHGPRALFAGILAHLELFFPIPSGDAEALDAQVLIPMYKEATALASSADCYLFTTRIADFLATRGEGISAELVEGLRTEMEEACADVSPVSARPATRTDEARPDSGSEAAVAEPSGPEDGVLC